MKHSTTKYARATAYRAPIMKNKSMSHTLRRRFLCTIISRTLLGTWLLRQIEMKMAVTGSPAITTQTAVRQRSCSVEEGKCMNQARAWSPPYTNAAAVKPATMRISWKAP
ncbi:hypothetical protein XANCAGTX0491_004704 [Xanthoria calcicola]